ncbi:MAG: hypothetical protein KKG60_03300 [Nanoarchaeota archaeon]|nr:hypothetical protein [Nanoarchaeota archaeon]
MIKLELTLDNNNKLPKLLILSGIKVIAHADKIKNQKPLWQIPKPEQYILGYFEKKNGKINTYTYTKNPTIGYHPLIFSTPNNFYLSEGEITLSYKSFRPAKNLQKILDDN